MKVLFFAYIRDYTGEKETEVQCSGTVFELLEALCLKYGSKFENIVFKDKKLSDQIIVLVNGRHISHIGGVNASLNKDDVISIFPVVAGG